MARPVLAGERAPPAPPPDGAITHTERTVNKNTTEPTFPLPQPLMAPIGVEITPEMVQEVWDTFVKPTQSDDAPPQSAEMRALMGILRAVYEALEAGPVPPGTWKEVTK